MLYFFLGASAVMALAIYKPEVFVAVKASIADLLGR